MHGMFRDVLMLLNNVPFSHLILLRRNRVASRTRYLQSYQDAEIPRY